jgi:hypothetical protein
LLSALLHDSFGVGAQESATTQDGHKREGMKGHLERTTHRHFLGLQAMPLRPVPPWHELARRFSKVF